MGPSSKPAKPQARWSRSSLSADRAQSTRYHSYKKILLSPCRRQKIEDAVEPKPPTKPPDITIEPNLNKKSNDAYNLGCCLGHVMIIDPCLCLGGLTHSEKQKTISFNGCPLMLRVFLSSLFRGVNRSTSNNRALSTWNLFSFLYVSCDHLIVILFFLIDQLTCSYTE